MYRLYRDIVFQMNIPHDTRCLCMQHIESLVIPYIARAYCALDVPRSGRSSKLTRDRPSKMNVQSSHFPTAIPDPSGRSFLPPGPQLLPPSNEEDLPVAEVATSLPNPQSGGTGSRPGSSKKNKMRDEVEGDSRRRVGRLKVRTKPAQCQRDATLFELSARAAHEHKKHHGHRLGRKKTHSVETIESERLGAHITRAQVDRRPSGVKSRSRDRIKEDIQVSPAGTLETLLAAPVPMPSLTGQDREGAQTIPTAPPQHKASVKGSPTRPRRRLILRRQMGAIDLVAAEPARSRAGTGQKAKDGECESQESLPSDVGVDFLLGTLYPPSIVKSVTSLRAPPTIPTPFASVCAPRTKKPKKPFCIIIASDKSIPQVHKSPEKRPTSPTIIRIIDGTRAGKASKEAVKSDEKLVAPRQGAISRESSSKRLKSPIKFSKAQEKLHVPSSVRDIAAAEPPGVPTKSEKGEAEGRERVREEGSLQQISREPKRKPVTSAPAAEAASRDSAKKPIMPSEVPQPHKPHIPSLGQIRKSLTEGEVPYQKAPELREKGPICPVVIESPHTIKKGPEHTKSLREKKSTFPTSQESRDATREGMTRPQLPKLPEPRTIPTSMAEASEVTASEVPTLSSRKPSAEQRAEGPPPRKSSLTIRSRVESTVDRRTEDVTSVTGHKPSTTLEEEERSVEPSAPAAPVHKTLKKRRDYETLSPLSPGEVHAGAPGETQLDRRVPEEERKPPPPPAVLKSEGRRRLSRQLAKEQLPVVPAPVPVTAPQAPQSRQKDRKAIKESPTEVQETHGGALPLTAQESSALRRHMGSIDLTTRTSSVSRSGYRGSRRPTLSPVLDQDDSRHADRKPPFAIPSDGGVGFLFERPSSRTMLPPIAPAARRFQPTRTISLPNLCDEDLMISPEFLRSRQVLKTDDSIYQPFILRKEYVIRTKLRVMFRLLRPEPPRLFRSYSEGNVTDVTFLTKYGEHFELAHEGEGDESEWRVEEGCNFFSICQLHVKCCKKRPQAGDQPPKETIT
ncbi:mediator of DNA damage checkpoint protein 1-like isoform X2 [Ornithodoros turicata]|uniref:mediator of DNA damage checkpoint protein 1-like isoform X2 n=1 Tax=Ornithodoros turicata TaxID=34597 RepID=UPI0031386861